MLVYDLFYKLLLLTFIMYTFFFLFLGLIVHFLTLTLFLFIYLFIFFLSLVSVGSLHFSTIVTLVTEQQVSSLFSYSFYQCSSFGSVFPGCKI